MAYQTDSIAGSGYGNVYIDSLVWGCGWAGVSATEPIYYYFGSGSVPSSDSSIGAFTGKTWTTTEKSAFASALAEYSSVCNLKFAETTNYEQADLVEWKAGNANMSGYLGMHEVPDETWSNIYGYFNSDDETWNYMQKGGYGYVSLVHELGHAMGLAHPHDGGGEASATLFPGVTNEYSLGTSGLNQGIWTTMTYNDGWSGHYSGSYAYGWQSGLMALDIAALQRLYGANMSAATGDNTYTLPTANASGTYWSCIWDAAGNDTISNAGSSKGCTINLNDAPLTGANAGGFVSYNAGILGGFTIANGATIENAIGGGGNDTLIGNETNNILNGSAGNDTMTGGAGNDIYYVDSLYDIVIELVGEGDDTIYSSVESYTLSVNAEHLILIGLAEDVIGDNSDNVITGNDLDNILIGDAGNDTLIGNNGNDTLNGGTGADTMLGCAGNDIYYVDNVRDVVVETANNGIDTVYSTLSSYTLTADVENLSLTGTFSRNGTGNNLANTLTGNTYANILVGGDGNDTLYGNVGNDTLNGGNGDDILDGGVGKDRMYGGSGNDYYYVDSSRDTVSEYANSGTDAVLTTLTSYTLGANLENLTLIGSFAQNGYGNSLANTLTGNAYANMLNGGAGNDILLGGDGNDYLFGSAGMDILTGGAGADTLAFKALTDSVDSALRDVITDFSASDGDRINLSALDANVRIKKNQAFTYIDTSDFSGVAGQLHFQSGILSGDVNGDAIADFSIQLIGVTSLAAYDIIL